MDLHNLLDIHTHHTGRMEALLSLPPQIAISGCSTPFSLEMHPWNIMTHDSGIQYEDWFMKAVQEQIGNPNLLAIGECGLDNKCGIPLERQLHAFRTALQIAHDNHLPVIIHCVGYWAEMMSCIREAGTETNIIHGYRKGSQLARQLLDEGFFISLGDKYNPDVARLIPDNRLYFETDESNTDIWSIRKKILSLR